MQINSPLASYLTPLLPPSNTFSNNFSSTHQEFHLILQPTSITYLLPVILCCFNLQIHLVSLICVLSFSSPLLAFTPLSSRFLALSHFSLVNLSCKLFFVSPLCFLVYILNWLLLIIFPLLPFYCLLLLLPSCFSPLAETILLNSLHLSRPPAVSYLSNCAGCLLWADFQNDTFMASSFKRKTVIL